MTTSKVGKERWEPVARSKAHDFGLNGDVFADQIETESNWQGKAVNKVSGATGLGQLVPKWYPEVNALNGDENLTAAAKTMARNLSRYKGDYAKALAAYNAGATAMDRWILAQGVWWRWLLRIRKSQWADVAGYGDERKAEEIARYLDKILGPEAPNMAEKPDVSMISSGNYGAGRRGKIPVAIVNHIMEGTLEGCDSWFTNPVSEVSAHFGVGKDGTIHQYVLEGDTAWANGQVNKPDRSIDWLDMAISMGTNPNLITLSIEHEGYSGDWMPDEQYQASLALQVYLVKAWGLQVDGDHIIGHNRIDSVNKLGCPGAGFDFTRLIVDLTAALAPPPVEELPVDQSEGSTALDDLTLIFNYAGDLYNAMIPTGETTYSQQWVAIAQKALAIQETVNRLKSG